MKQFFRLLPIIAISFMSYCCNEDDIDIIDTDKRITFKLVTDSLAASKQVDTYATQMGNDGENRIRNLRIVFTQLDGTTIVKTVDISSVPTPTLNVYTISLVLTQAEASAAKSVWVIANYDGNPSHDASYSSYYTTPLSSEPEIPTVSTPSSYIPMTGKLINHDFENSPSYTINMIRTMSKLRIHTIKSPLCDAGLEVHWDEIKCSIINATKKTALWGTDPRDMATTSGVTFMNYIHTSQRREPGFNSQLSSYPTHSIIDSCYINENYRADVSTYNSNNTTMLRITIPTTLSVGGYSYPKKNDVYDIPLNNTNSKQISRNTIYDLYVNIIGQSEMPTIYSNIKDWTDIEVMTAVAYNPHIVSFSRNYAMLQFNPLEDILQGDTIYFLSRDTVTGIANNVSGLDISIVYDDDSHKSGKVIFLPNASFDLSLMNTSLYIYPTGTIFRELSPYGTYAYGYTALCNKYMLTGTLVDNYIPIAINTPFALCQNTINGAFSGVSTWAQTMGYTYDSNSHDTSVTPPIENGTGCRYMNRPGKFRVPTLADATKIFTYGKCSVLYNNMVVWIDDEGDMSNNNRTTHAKFLYSTAPGYSARVKTNSYNNLSSACINNNWKISHVKY